MLTRRDSHGLGGGWIFLIVVILLAILAFGSWVLYSRLRARRLGLPAPPLNPFSSSRSSAAPPYPAPAPGGVVGWINDKVRAFKNRRHATGAYEEPYPAGGRTGGRSARGPLDPDEPWDAGVDNEAHYEEQELGLHAPSTAYGGGGYGAPSPGFAPAPERGRSRTRDLADRYDEEVGYGGNNPFGDDAASSLRGVSPRPVEQQQQREHQSKASVGSNENSPSERRSMFRENM
jgi:hypothetical protein